jgi:hypothetical protein
MAEIAKASIPSPCSPSPSPDCFPTYQAGADIKAGDSCYVSGHDAQGQPLAFPAGGAGATGLQLTVRGQAAADANLGDAVTLCRGLRFFYGAGLTDGVQVYLSGTVAGGIADAAVAGAAPIGFAVDSSRVEFFYPH